MSGGDGNGPLGLNLVYKHMVQYLHINFRGPLPLR